MITPGKWEADTEGEYVFTRVPEGLMIVAQMWGWSYLTGELNLSSEEAIEVQKANARLMAAAPELYEAVCDLLGRVHIKRASNIIASIITEIKFTSSFS